MDSQTILIDFVGILLHFHFIFALLLIQLLTNAVNEFSGGELNAELELKKIGKFDWL